MKHIKRSITGVLLLDKPVGISSNAALSRVKTLFNADKAGHTGTLDPLASGLLPVCLGEATKFAGYMLDADKAYEAVIRLGRTTTTGDKEGAVISELPVEVSEAMIRRVIDQFTGQISQVPPMYSALKRDGQPLYRLARQGVTVFRESREITIYQLDLLVFEPPLISVSVVCSKGTYVRVLAEDIGQTLGCGASLEALRRTRVGAFALGDAVTLDQLADLPLSDRDLKLSVADQLIADLPRVNLDEQIGRAVLQGRVVSDAFNLSPALYRSYGPEGNFLGVVEVENGNIKARRMMSTFLSGPK